MYENPLIAVRNQQLIGIGDYLKWLTLEDIYMNLIFFFEWSRSSEYNIAVKFGNRCVHLNIFYEEVEEMKETEEVQKV